MHNRMYVTTVIAMMCMAIFALLPACSLENGEDGEEHGGRERGGEEHGGGEGDEESGTQYTRTQTHDEVRRGMRLVLDYDSGANQFVGMVTNTTSATIKCVRVEVHLSSGIELGPTPRQDVAPGSEIPVALSDEGRSFTTWSAHPGKRMRRWRRR